MLTKMKQRLSREMEEAFCSRIELGGADGKAATAELVDAADGIARKIAAAFNSYHVSFDDFLQEARIGLLKAIPKHMEGAHRAEGGRYTTIAFIMARAECSRLYERAAHSGFKLPQTEFWTMRKIDALREEGLDVEAISVYLGLEEERVEKCLRTPLPPAMMSRESMGVGREEPIDALDEDTNVEHDASSQVDARILLDSLPARLRQATKLKFGIGIPEPLDEKEIARVFGITVAQIRKILRSLEDYAEQT